MSVGRYDEASARYNLARAAASEAGDKELEGSIFQHQGSLAHNRKDLEGAIRLYQQALKRFQEGGNFQAVMLSYNLLGQHESAEQHALRGLTIAEELQNHELSSSYMALSEIAQARGDLTAAAEWAQKRDDLLEELERRARGGGGPPV